MRSGIVSLAGCILLFGSITSAQTPTFRAADPVIGAAGKSVTSLTPGSLFSIYGNNLANTLADASSTTLSTSMIDVDSVTVGGIKAPLRFVSVMQINAQVPWGVAPGPANVVVTRNGVASQPTVAPVAQFSPAVYNLSDLNQAVAVNSDGTFAATGPTLFGYGAHPAVAGDFMFFYASGLGAVDKQPPADGVNSIETLRNTANKLTVKIGGVDAKVDFAGLSPQFTGVYQVNVVVPSGVTPGSAVFLQLAIGGVESPSSDTTKISTIAMR